MNSVHKVCSPPTVFTVVVDILDHCGVLRSYSTRERKRNFNSCFGKLGSTIQLYKLIYGCILECFVLINYIRWYFPSQLFWELDFSFLHKNIFNREGKIRKDQSLRIVFCVFRNNRKLHNTLWCCVQKRLSSWVLTYWGSPVFLLSLQAEWSGMYCRQRGWLRSGISGAVDPACISTGQHPVWQRLRSRLLPGCDRGLRSLRRPQRTKPVYFLRTVSVHITVITVCYWLFRSFTRSQNFPLINPWTTYWPQKMNSYQFGHSLSLPHDLRTKQILISSKQISASQRSTREWSVLRTVCVTI